MCSSVTPAHRVAVDQCAEIPLLVAALRSTRKGDVTEEGKRSRSNVFKLGEDLNDTGELGLWMKFYNSLFPSYLWIFFWLFAGRQIPYAFVHNGIGYNNGTASTVSAVCLLQLGDRAGQLQHSRGNGERLVSW